MRLRASPKWSTARVGAVGGPGGLGYTRFVLSSAELSLNGSWMHSQATIFQAGRWAGQ